MRTRLRAATTLTIVNAGSIPAASIPLFKPNPVCAECHAARGIESGFDALVRRKPLTAIPLGIAFLLRSFRGEKLAGLAVVAVIFFSACVAFYESIQRLLHPQILTHLWARQQQA